MPSEQLEIEYSPRRQRMFVFLAALSAMFAIAGVVAFATMSDDAGSEQASPAETPRDLVTDGLDGPIAIETQAPTIDPAPTRSTAVVHADANGIDFACTDVATADGLVGIGGIYELGCTATSVGDFSGQVSFTCDVPDWVVCDATLGDGNVSPEHALERMWTIGIRHTAPPGPHSFRMVARAGGVTYEDVVPLVVRGPGEPVEAFVCNVMSSWVLAGEIKRVDCTYVPAGFRGVLHPVCEAPDPLTACDMPSTVTVTSDAPVHFNGTWTFDVMAPPGDYGPLEISLPDRDRRSTVLSGISPPTGTFGIDCPVVVTTVALSLQTTCTATSVDGFDGFVRFTAAPGADLASLVGEPSVVRVAPGEPVDVAIDLVSLVDLPIGTHVSGLRVRGETATLTVDSDAILVQVV